MPLKDPEDTVRRRREGALVGWEIRRRRALLTGELWQADWPGGCCGVLVEQGVIGFAAPLLSWSVGLKIDRLCLWLKGKGGKLSACSLACAADPP